VQKAAGDLTDNGTQKMKGIAHEAEGKVQKKFGDVKEELRKNDERADDQRADDQRKDH
jgi:uncharacterized protein YjbJ (UPF0337 family)